jgi:hypothetical protein
MLHGNVRQECSCIPGIIRESINLSGNVSNCMHSTYPSDITAQSSQSQLLVNLVHQTAGREYTYEGEYTYEVDY